VGMLPDGVVYVSGDFGDSELISGLLECHDEIIYLAYATTPNTSHHTPVLDLLQNIPSVVHLYSEIAAKRGKLVIVSSGGTVYGEALKLPIQEDHPTKPISPYGLTKLTIENYAHLYSVTHGLKYVCVRPSNAYGVGQYPFSGQGFIATALATAMRGETIKIFGTNGTIRDYLYVTDIAAGIVCALNHGHIANTYNLGSGYGLSNRQVVDIMFRLLQNEGFSFNINCLPVRPFDVAANVLDSSKLALHTGWKPHVSFEDGLRLTLDWLRIIND
jgi:UDP-glucose 4-epimerase